MFIQIKVKQINLEGSSILVYAALEVSLSLESGIKIFYKSGLDLNLLVNSSDSFILKNSRPSVVIRLTCFNPGFASQQK